MLEKSVGVWESNVIVRRENIFCDQRIFGKNNKIWISGIIEEEFEYSHEYLGSKFYKTRVIIKRMSGIEDSIPLIVQDYLLTDILRTTQKGKYVEVGGQFRSYNENSEDGKKHLKLFVFARYINIYEKEEELEEGKNINSVYLDGYICRKPTFRIRASGVEISDILIAVPRENKRTDYIHCIAWNKVAEYASTLNIGDRIEISGRAQSRQYFKQFSSESEEEGEWREAYEISIMWMKKIN